MIINIKDKISSAYAISAKKGEIIRNIIEENIENKDEIILDFEGITSTISTFFNECYASFFEKYELDYLDKKIIFKNTSQITDIQIRTVKENALKFYKK